MYEALSIARQRLEVSSNTIRNREPFGYRKFKASSPCLHKYSNMVLTMGHEWIGCWYKTPILWYPLHKYHNDYNLNDKEVN